jgi:triosephosphate isomerase
VPRRLLLAANWKLNPVRADEAIELARTVTPAATAHAEKLEVALFPPFPWLSAVGQALSGTGVGLGAQDCYWEATGAYTGEVSAAMVATLAGWVITGHSERRQHFCETNEAVARKTAAALAAGLRVIACVGERLEQLEAGMTESVVSSQVGAVLAGLQASAATRLAIAYEPVWAIGTGRSAEPAQAGATMGLIRRVAAEALGQGAALELRVLYGGSVKAANAASYVEVEGCDGLLVGGASLQADEFTRMIQAVARAAVER